MQNFDIWDQSFNKAAEVLDKLRKSPDLMGLCRKFSDLLIESYKNNRNVFIAGNGGSHCDAMHFAEELTGQYSKSRRPLGALALGDPSHVTCVSNDYGFEHIFSRQLQALARPGDVFVGLSTSGNSKNIIEALKIAKKLDLKTVALLGKSGGEAKTLADLSLVMPADTSERIQELHIKIIHTAIESIERALFPENY